MSRENVEALRHLYEAFSQGDLGPLVEMAHAEMEWNLSAHPLPDFPDRGRGREAFMAHFAEYLSGWDDHQFVLNDLRPSRDEVVVVQREYARMRDSNVVLDRDLPVVWTFRGGKAVLVRVFQTNADAFAAVGMPE
jgi:ketosteroid isomerase-like protein